MSFGLKKDNAKNATTATDLFAQCERVYAANTRLVREDSDGCADYLLNLVSPNGRNTYVLTVSNDPYRSYGLFSQGKYAGHGSFIGPEGGFLRHGRITQADAGRILTTFIPTAGRA
jgi:hypothetical protein